MQSHHDTALRIAKILIDIEAVKLNPGKPYKWSSGWLSPIYCDNRIALSYPEHRKYIKNCLSTLISKQYPDSEGIAGVATAGIAQGALVAEMLGLPFAYVRPKPKEHGMENLIEGKISKKQKIVVVEDLVSTGGSSLKAVDALRDHGAEVLGMVCIFTYDFDIATQNMKNAKVNLHALCTYHHMIEICKNAGLFPETVIASLENWRKSPENWQP